VTGKRFIRAVPSRPALERDREADARDAAAEARDALAAELDRQIDELQRSAGADTGLALLVRAANDRKLAAASRARAAAAREAAARDRALARRDREQAAADRLAAEVALTEEGFDDLTGALRRGVGLAALGREVERTQRTGTSLVVAFVDVDGLKAVNDGRGHPAGDELLRGVVESIQSALRPYDVVMRYGGDEFVCSLAGQGLEGAQERFADIATEISRCDGATITVGLVERQPGETRDELIARADQAMIGQRVHH
jgi:diguanylate cyclase (GGDEF)-like protein